MPNMPKHSAPQNWRRVWEYVDARREAEGLTWAQIHEDSGISERTYTQMRKQGKPLTLASKRAALASYMGWTLDSFDRIGAGMKPRAVKQAQPVVVGGASPDDLYRIFLILEHLEEIAENVMTAMQAIPELVARLPGPAPSTESPTDHADS